MQELFMLQSWNYEFYGLEKGPCCAVFHGTFWSQSLLDDVVAQITMTVLLWDETFSRVYVGIKTANKITPSFIRTSLIENALDHINVMLCTLF